VRLIKITIKLSCLACIYVFLFTQVSYALQEGVSRQGDWIIVEVESSIPTTFGGGGKNVVRNEARRVANLYALEKALGAFIDTSAMLRDDDLRERIFSKTRGFIRDPKILREWEKDGMFHIIMRCKVSEVDLDGELGPAMIDWLGNPRIIILINERIEGSSTSVTKGETQKAFEKAGYRIISPPQIAIDSKTVQSHERVKNILETHGADVLVYGEANYENMGNFKRESVTIYGIRSTVHLTAVLNNAKYLGSDTVEVKTQSVSVRNGATKGFEAATKKAASSIVYKIAYALVPGAPGINIEVTNISHGAAQSLIKSLEDVHGVTAVYLRKYGNSTLEAEILSDRQAADVASLLSERSIEVEEITFNTVKGRKIN